MAGKEEIRLTHFCNLKEAKGRPGDVIKVDAEVANRLIDTGGARRLSDEKANESGGMTKHAFKAEADKVKGELNDLREQLRKEREELEKTRAELDEKASAIEEEKKKLQAR